jgi:hypothetical protein
MDRTYKLNPTSRRAVCLQNYFNHETQVRQQGASCPLREMKDQEVESQGACTAGVCRREEQRQEFKEIELAGLDKLRRPRYS